MTPTDRPTREDVKAALERVNEHAKTHANEGSWEYYTQCDRDCLLLRCYIENGIVIDRDKVPKGLKEALEGTKSTAVVDNLDKLMLWNEQNETIRKAAALLAEKVDG